MEESQYRWTPGALPYVAGKNRAGLLNLEPGTSECDNPPRSFQRQFPGKKGERTGVPHPRVTGVQSRFPAIEKHLGRDPWGARNSTVHMRFLSFELETDGYFSG